MVLREIRKGNLNQIEGLFRQAFNVTNTVKPEK